LRRRRKSMHDVEFLPQWYPALHRRKLALFVQGGASLAIVILLATVLFAREWDIRCQREIVAQLDQQIHRTNQQLKKLDVVLAFQKQLREQERGIHQLGTDISAARVVNALESSMTSKTALTGLSVETQDPSPVLSGQPPVGAPEHWLNVRVQGVAPADVEVAILLDRLSRLKFLDSVAMSYIRDRSEAGHTMRDFELRFRVNLNAPAEDGT
jgi:Tfp pilus assembly protein PilN